FRTRSRMEIFELTAGQGRSTLKCMWFHGGYLRDRFKPGQMVALYGKVQTSNRNGRLNMGQPQFEVLAEASEGEEGEGAAPFSLETGRIVPIYESAWGQKLSSRWFRRVLWRALEQLPSQIGDSLPPAVLERMELIGRREAFQLAHFPDTGESFADLQAA